MATAYLGLGSNLGDRAATILGGVKALRQSPGVVVRRVSGLYESAAVDSPMNAPRFYNAVAEVETTLSPHELLTTCQAIEEDFGRVRPANVVNAPRSLDIDVVAIGQLQSKDDVLTLPHPRMTQRDFVLRPLAEIAPEWRHPVLNLTAGQLAGRSSMGRARRMGDETAAKSRASR